MGFSLKKVFQSIANSFSSLGESLDPDSESATDSSSSPTGQDLYEDTETAGLEDFDGSATESYDLREEEDLTPFWWYYQGTDDFEVPVFEGIDDELVCRELQAKIEANEFPVIEIPDTVMKTMQILNNPEFDFLEVANLINRSPAMAGEFIKIANSSIYRRGVDIQDLKLALPRLGKDNIKAMLFMYSSKLSLADNPLFNELAVDIVDHSYATALIASYLSQRFYPDPDSAFLAGLLHDIGKLGILKAISKMYDLPSQVEFEMTEEVFDNIFPSLHEQAGYFLGENWQLNKIVLSAIQHHHDFFDTTFSEDSQLELHLNALVNISDTMAKILGKGRRVTETVNIYETSAAIILNIERNDDNDRFLSDIPGIVSFKTSK